MTSRGTLPRMDPRSRQSTGLQQRHSISKMYPENTCSYSTHIPAYDAFPMVSQPQEFSAELAPCWSGINDTFAGNDSSYIPATWVSPIDVMHQSWDSLSATDAESTRSSVSSKNCISPPLSEVELGHYGMEPFPAPYQDWSDAPQLLTPPDDTLDELFICKDGQADLTQLPEPAIPAMSFHSASSQRMSQPRPIRSASERSSSSSSSSGNHKEQSMERTKNNPRNDPRYDAKPDKDGYYHCPFAGSADPCNHQPNKQKCIYAKNLDSHLKPYVCKFGAQDENCRSLRFSSNACLFRHEREMHGLHNHGMNPYLCIFEGCERARRDNGFPRRWNQRDHMKRVHGWEEQDNDNENAVEVPRRRKGPGASSSVPMKRSGSSRFTAAPYFPGSRPSTTPRFAPMPRKVPGPNYVLAGMAEDNYSYGSQPVMTANYSAPLYAQY